MIDIRAIVAKIVEARKASDDLAFTIHTHKLVRQYGQELLGSVAGAITASTQEEIALVDWLRGELVKMLNQIPGPTP